MKRRVAARLGAGLVGAAGLGEPETQGRTDGELYFLVSNGVRLTGMPGFERSLPEDLRWDLVAFVRALPKLDDEELKALSRR